MPFYDLIFPLNLGPLTYSGPDGLKPGTFVSAEVRKTPTKGVVLRALPDTPNLASVKEISEVYGELLSVGLVSLISWMADYYFRKEGVVLKEILPKEIIKKIDSSYFIPVKNTHDISAATESDDIVFKKLSAHAASGRYRTFLLHAPYWDYQAEIIAKLVRQHRGILVLCPEIEGIRHIIRAIGNAAGGRMAVIHSALTPAKRQSEMKKIITGSCDIVVGSRTALFAPLKNPSFIIVIDEESLAHKKHKGLPYSVRDVAVMRGFLEGATVLLSSICPSFESFFNAKSGRYTLLKPVIPVKRPAVKVIDMRTSKKITTGISRPLYERTANVLKKDGKVAFVINRRGYGMLECEECGWLRRCNDCDIPMMFHKAENLLRCGLCGLTATVLNVCERCGSPKLSIASTGIERIEEEIMTLFGRPSFRLEGKKPKPALELIDSDIVIGTKLIAKKKTLSGRFNLIGVINGDAYLNRPDFRAQEITFQELIHLSERCLSEGELLIQSRLPSMSVFKAIKKYDFDRFYEDGLRTRRELFYPPYAKIALIRGKSMPQEEIRELPLGVQVMGPAPDAEGWKMLLKAKNRLVLKKAVSYILKKLPDAEVEMDPLLT